MAATFETARLAVRPWAETEDDVAAMLDTYRRDEVARWLGARPQPLTSAEEARARIARWAPYCEGVYGIWAVVPHAVGHPVGTVLLLRLPDADGARTDDVEVGWHLHPEHWGHGYATEAASGALARAWAAGLTRVHAVVRPGNERSVAVTRRLGMRPMGRTDRWYGVELEAFSLDRPGR